MGWQREKGRVVFDSLVQLLIERAVQIYQAPVSRGFL